MDYRNKNTQKQQENITRKYNNKYYKKKKFGK